METERAAAQGVEREVSIHEAVDGFVDLTWDDVAAAADCLADRWRGDKRLVGVYGVPRGGCVPAAMVAERLQLPLLDLRDWPPEGAITEEELPTKQVGGALGKQAPVVGREANPPRGGNNIKNSGSTRRTY